MNCLALDTSTEAMGICLKTDTDLVSFSQIRGYRHAVTLVPWISRICRETGFSPDKLDVIVVGTGPGSFTGLRIGMASAKGLAAGAGCPLVGVPTLDAFAWGLRNAPGLVLPVIDARKNRLYTAFYRDGSLISPYFDLREEELMRRISEQITDGVPLLLTGSYATELEKKFSAENKFSYSVDPCCSLLNPYNLMDRGLSIFHSEGGGSDDLTPLYLRKSEAETKIETC